MNTSEIESIKFVIASENQVINNGVVQVLSSELFKKNLPFADGLYDPKMGSTDYSISCTTCKNNKSLCPGHPGYYKLNYPVYLPLFISEIPKWLKIICFQCGRIVIGEEKLKDAKNRFEAAVEKTSTISKNCEYCGAIHPAVSKSKYDLITFNTVIKKKGDDKKQILSIQGQPLYPHNVKMIFERITNDTVKFLNKPLESHPKNLVTDTMIIPPNTIRPELKKFNGEKSKNNDATIWLQKIIKTNEKIPDYKISEYVNAPDKLKQGVILNTLFYSYIIDPPAQSTKLQATDSSLKKKESIFSRIPKKEGRIKSNLLGKRCWGIARSVIVGDPTVKIDELTIPLRFAKEMQIEEIIQPYNIDKLRTIFLNGDKYPGCSAVKSGKTGIVSKRNCMKVDNIKMGDIIRRDLIDGDVVLFNRAPTLIYSSITAHRIKVDTSVGSLTIRMNVLACSMYNADFDGDQMNIHCLSNIMSQNEAMYLSSVPNWFISYKNSIPAFGQVQDSCIGAFKLTSSDVRVNKLNAMKLFANIDQSVTFDKPEYTGREIISLLIPRINFERVANFYNTAHTSHINFVKEDTHVVIKRGKCLSGILDKKSIGGGSLNGLYHLIFSRSGAEKTLKIIFNHQQLILNYLMNCGFSLGIKDLWINELTRKENKEIIDKLLSESDIITSELTSGTIIAPIGKSVSQFYEERQLAILKDDFLSILNSMSLKNSLYQLVSSGSKGNWSQVINMMGAIGQVEILGKRVEESFAFRRTLPYFSRYETKPAARGFIVNSYMSGLSASELIFESMRSRRGTISVALGTAIAGDQTKIAMKNLESLVLSHYGIVMRHNMIVQQRYGDDGIDVRKLLTVQYLIYNYSDQDIRNKCCLDTLPGNIKDEEYNVIREERDFYRYVFMKTEVINIAQYMTGIIKLPVNVYQIKEDAIYDYTHDKDEKEKPIDLPTKEQVIRMYKKVQAFIANLPYLFTNEHLKKIQYPLPEYLKHTQKFLVCTIHANLCTKELARMNEEILNVVLIGIETKFSNSIMHPGASIGVITALCFTEESTQGYLDSKHGQSASGFAKKGLNSIKELIGVRPIRELTEPRMIMFLKPEYEDQAKIVASKIESVKMFNFVTKAQVFFEKYGQIIHPLYKHENKMIEDFNNMNPFNKPSAQLLPWCLRFEFNLTMLILKNVTIEEIVLSLKKKYPKLHIVYTHENSEFRCMRIYMDATFIETKTTVSLPMIKDIMNMLLSSVIKGIENIRSVILQEGVEYSYVNKDKDNALEKKKVNRMLTLGTGIYDVLSHIPEIDPNTIQTDVIREVAYIFGIEAARLKILNELRSMQNTIDLHHMSIYADEMIRSGKLLPINRDSVKYREPKNKLLHIASASPRMGLITSTINAQEMGINGLSAPLIVGTTPNYGSTYSKIIVNEKFLKNKRVNVEEILDNI